MAKKKENDEAGGKKKPAPKPYTPQYGVIVLCDSESHQEEVYNNLKKENYRCKVVTA